VDEMLCHEMIFKMMLQGCNRIIRPDIVALFTSGSCKFFSVKAEPEEENYTPELHDE